MFLTLRWLLESKKSSKQSPGSNWQSHPPGACSQTTTKIVEPSHQNRKKPQIQRLDYDCVNI
ncbi:hypothetical protein COCVIDRAFT_115251 [Bipolaris victoriae FI3]|uniref:Uncharacterized protein n=1 Tax=Bipolaris victoriae (strain FI3) TaxID=930091 RepID=W7EA38_BIPV3|nr:hypothetical protein COCVIDRAFT_115251 [Bipolaris victoriae FI3]